MLSLVALSVSLSAVNAAPAFHDLSSFTTGFVAPVIVPSIGGYATRIQRGHSCSSYGYEHRPQVCFTSKPVRDYRNHR